MALLRGMMIRCWALLQGPMQLVLGSLLTPIALPIACHLGSGAARESMPLNVRATLQGLRCCLQNTRWPWSDRQGGVEESSRQPILHHSTARWAVSPVRLIARHKGLCLLAVPACTQRSQTSWVGRQPCTLFCCSIPSSLGVALPQDGADVLVPLAAYVWAAWIWLAPLVWVRGWDSYVPEKGGLQGEPPAALKSLAHSTPCTAWPVAAHALQHLHLVCMLSVLLQPADCDELPVSFNLWLSTLLQCSNPVGTYSIPLVPYC